MLLTLCLNRSFIELVRRNFTKFRHATLLKKKLWHRCFPVNFAKLSKNTIFTEHVRTTASRIKGLYTKLVA